MMLNCLILLLVYAWTTLEQNCPINCLQCTNDANPRCLSCKLPYYLNTNWWCGLYTPV